MAPFREEFELLSALYARKVRLWFSTIAGISVEVLNGYPERNGFWHLPDLPFGGEAWALVRLRVPARLIPELGSRPLLKAMASMVSVDGAPIQPRAVSLSLPPLDAAAFSVVGEDPLVRRRAMELEAAQYQEEARAAALRGDWTEVGRILEAARARADDNEWIQQSLQVLERYARRRQRSAFTKEAYYTSRKMRRRLTSHEEEDWSDDEDGPTFLRRRREQGRSQS
jgi:Ca-activated chloride channel family protein